MCRSNSVIVIANSDNDSNQMVLITVILMIGMTAKTIMITVKKIIK